MFLSCMEATREYNSKINVIVGGESIEDKEMKESEHRERETKIEDAFLVKCRDRRFIKEIKN